MKKDIILYSVPQIHKATGGPRTRVLQISKALNDNFNAQVITGSNVTKFHKSIKAPKTNVLYIESTTNRLKLFDFLNILILKTRSTTTIVYIRDVYREIYPELYRSFRGKISNFLNHITNMFYVRISDKMCFPTTEMADSFFQLHPTFQKKPTFAFPPGSFIPKYKFKDKIYNEQRQNIINFLYLGGTKYINSGFRDYLNLANKLGDKYVFYIISNEDLNAHTGNKVKIVNNLEHSEVIEFIYEKNITFAIHTRPFNQYDNITFPIKFLDYISCLLPVITLPHSPLKSILPTNYPFYVNRITEKEIDNILRVIKDNSDIYQNTINSLKEVRDNLVYENLIKQNLL